MERSQSIVDSITGFEDEVGQNFRQKEWDFKRTISELMIKIEAEKKRNDYLEENYIKLPVNIEEMQNMKTNLSLAQMKISQIEPKLQNSEELAQKYKKDLETFRDYAFKEIKDKEFTIIEQGTSIRKLESDLNTLKTQSAILLDQYEQFVKKPNVYKEKYRKVKTEVRELKTQRSSNFNKTDMEFMNAKLELANAQKRITDLTQSREELAKKCLELEQKNQSLNSDKSEIRSRLHKKTKTLTEMEYEFKNILVDIESGKSEEVVELLEKVAMFEKIIKDLKQSHAKVIDLKMDEISKEKLNFEELKRQYGRLEGQKHKVETDLISCKAVLEDHNNILINQQMEYEEKIEKLKSGHLEKVIKYKRQITELEMENQRMQEETNEMTRKSFMVEESLFNELDALDSDVRGSRLFITKNYQESMIRPSEDPENKLEMLKEKISKIKAKRAKISEDLAQKLELISNQEKDLKKNREIIRLKEEITGQKNDEILELTHKIQQFNLESQGKEKEILRLKAECDELNQSVKEANQKVLTNEAEFTRIKSSFEEKTLKLKEKYNEKIMKYKEDILILTERCSGLREHFEIKPERQSVNLEAATKLLKKNTKLKGKVENLVQCLKSKSELISKMQEKLKEVYSIPKVDEDLNEFESNLPVITEEKEEDEELKKEERRIMENYESKIRLLKGQIEELLKTNQELRETKETVHQILIISEPAEMVEIQAELIGKVLENKTMDIEKNSTQSVKVVNLQEKIKKLAEKLNFSTEVVSYLPKHSEKLEEGESNHTEDIVTLTDVLEINEEFDDSLEIEKGPTLLPLPDAKLQLSSTNPFSIEATPHKSLYIIKENYPDTHAELLKSRFAYEESLQNLKNTYEEQINELKSLLEKKPISNLMRASDPSQEILIIKDQSFQDPPVKIQDFSVDNSESMKRKIEDLETKRFLFEQEILVKTEKLKKSENESHEFLKKFKVLQMEHEELLEKYEKSEEMVKKLTEMVNNRQTTNLDPYSESEESVSRSGRGSRLISLSIDELITEESVNEDHIFSNPFDAFRESLMCTSVLNPEKNVIEELELELSEKINKIRVLQENIRDLQYQIHLLEKENLGLRNQASATDKTIEQFTIVLKSRDPSRDMSNGAALVDAKMTLLEAHNHRLETELIVSKTNWGELTNSLLRDNNELEKLLSESQNDIRLLSGELEKFRCQVHEKVEKSSKWNIFRRKKRNSNIS